MKTRSGLFRRRPSIKQILLLVVAFLVLISSCQQQPIPSQPVDLVDAPAHNPMVHQEGTRIVDGAGNPLELKGVNLSGWLFWEGWVWGGGFTPETKILQRLEELVGPEATKQFQMDVYNN